MRIRFDGTRPAGNTVSGSRGSGKDYWHSCHTLHAEWDGSGFLWKRTTGDDPEVHGENCIGAPPPWTTLRLPP